MVVACSGLRCLNRILSDYQSNSLYWWRLVMNSQATWSMRDIGHSIKYRAISLLHPSDRSLFMYLSKADAYLASSPMRYRLVVLPQSSG